MAKKPAVAAPMPHHVEMGQMAQSGMMGAPSNEVGPGISGHFTNLHENYQGQAAAPYQTQSTQRGGK